MRGMLQGLGRRGRGKKIKAGFTAAVVLAMSMLTVGVTAGVASAAPCTLTVAAPVVTPLHADFSWVGTYSGPVKNFTFSIDWGDGSTSDLTSSIGATPWSGTASHDYAAAGNYTVVLSFIHSKLSGQDRCDSTQDTFPIVVPPVNQPPVVSCPTMTPTDLTVAFTANASDPDGTIANYHWDFGDGNTADTSTGSTSHTYSTGGTYQVSMTVTDNDGATASTASTCPVHVTAPVVPPVNQPPVVACPTFSVNGLAVTASAVASDIDGTIANYHWTWGDGSTSDTSSASASHTYATAGTYTVGVSVTDNDGASTAAVGCSGVTVAAANGGSNGGSNGGTTVSGTHHSNGGTQVLGERKTMPKTGANVAWIALFGMLMLALGTVMRYGKPRPVRTVFAGQGAVANMVEAFGLSLRARPVRVFGTAKM